MNNKSDIEWTDATWNPVRGCVKVSPGCKHCYAETFAKRFRGVPGHPYEQGFDPRLVATALDAPLHWKKPRKIFVNSMSDMFGEFVPDDYIAAVFGIMAACPQHTFQVLTKRAKRMREYLRHQRVLPNVHIGVSVEDRKYGLPRIEHLAVADSAVRFLSIEPLLEDLGTLDLTGIHWVIVGGESGHGARPVHPDWVRSIRDQCVTAGVPFFFKQWGEWWPCEKDDTRELSFAGAKEARVIDGNKLSAMLRIGKKNAGRLLDGLEWNEVPK